MSRKKESEGGIAAMARYRGMNEYSSPGVYWIGTELGVYESAEVVVPQSD